MTSQQLESAASSATTEASLRVIERMSAAFAILALEFGYVEFAIRRMEEMARLTKVRQQVQQQVA